VRKREREIYIYIYVCICICIYVYIYVYVYIHTYANVTKSLGSRAIDKVRIKEKREIKIRRERGNGTQCGEQSSTLVQS